MASGKILITAFEPFGFLRGVLIRKNASKDVLEMIRNTYGVRFEYLLLPVSPEGEQEFVQLIERILPAGIVSLGEYMFQSAASIKVEPYAVRAPLSVLPRLGRGQEIQSSFAANMEYVTDRESSSIGLFYCNRVYVRGLEWARSHGNRPAVFLHIPVLGDRKTHYHQVMGVVERMDSE